MRKEPAYSKIKFKKEADLVLAIAARMFSLARKNNIPNNPTNLKKHYNLKKTDTACKYIPKLKCQQMSSQTKDW